MLTRRAPVAEYLSSAEEKIRAIVLGSTLRSSGGVALEQSPAITPSQMVGPHGQCLHSMRCCCFELLWLRGWSCGKRAGYDIV
eukprot:1654489-Amphidinium_carterae.1